MDLAVSIQEHVYHNVWFETDFYTYFDLSIGLTINFKVLINIKVADLCYNTKQLRIT